MTVNFADLPEAPRPQQDSLGLTAMDRGHLLTLIANGLIWAALQMEKDERLSRCGAEIKDPTRNYKYARLIAESVVEDIKSAGK